MWGSDQFKHPFNGWVVLLKNNWLRDEQRRSGRSEARIVAACRPSETQEFSAYEALNYGC
jgi:hypothetical protein